MQRPNISKRIIIISPSKRKYQVTFGSNFDPGLDRANPLGCPVYKNGAIWHVLLHFECSYNKS